MHFCPTVLGQSISKGITNSLRSVVHPRVSEIVMAIKMPTVLWEKNFCIRQYKLDCPHFKTLRDGGQVGKRLATQVTHNYCYVMQLSGNGSLTTILSYFYGYYSISLNFYLFLFKNVH